MCSEYTVYDLTWIWLNGYSVHGQHGTSASDSILTERWVWKQLRHSLTQWIFFFFFLKQMNRNFFLRCGAVRSSTPSHPFTTPTTWSWPTASWVPHGANWIKNQLLYDTLKTYWFYTFDFLWVQKGYFLSNKVKKSIRRKVYPLGCVCVPGQNWPTH